MINCSNTDHFIKLIEPDSEDSEQQLDDMITGIRAMAAAGTYDCAKCGQVSGRLGCIGVDVPTERAFYLLPLCRTCWTAATQAMQQTETSSTLAVLTRWITQ